MISVGSVDCGREVDRRWGPHSFERENRCRKSAAVWMKIKGSLTLTQSSLIHLADRSRAYFGSSQLPLSSTTTSTSQPFQFLLSLWAGSSMCVCLGKALDNKILFSALCCKSLLCRCIREAEIQGVSPFPSNIVLCYNEKSALYAVN